mmetsp:Transcript_3835/g.8765  ORF Transcript_3835/g.8765 Transcript_3835/m.8765 type:complete len:81 (-) Transcript_3835:172-414(-)
MADMAGWTRVQGLTAAAGRLAGWLSWLAGPKVCSCIAFNEQYEGNASKKRKERIGIMVCCVVCVCVQQGGEGNLYRTSVV